MSFWKTTTTIRMIDESSAFSRLKQRGEVGPLRDDVDEEDDAEADAHLHRARSAKDEQRAVDDVGHEQDVGDVGEDAAEGPAREEVKEALEHQGPPFADFSGVGLAAEPPRSRPGQGALEVDGLARRSHVVHAEDGGAGARRVEGRGDRGAEPLAGRDRSRAGRPGAASTTTARNDLRLAPTATGLPTARDDLVEPREELQAVAGVLGEAEARGP